MTTIVYHHPGLPRHWVVEHMGDRFIVPAVADGWRDKRPYHGHDISLQRVDAWHGLGLGIPDYPRNAGVEIDNAADVDNAARQEMKAAIRRGYGKAE